jgi:hypothetical protein
MTDDKQRAAERRRRMNELLAQAEADVARTRAAKEDPVTGPVVEVRRGRWLNNVLGVVILLVLAFVLGATAMTIARFTGRDFQDARLRGTATVEQCERRGPVSLKGFGYYQRCTVDIDWDTAAGIRVAIDKPGFFTNAKPGDTFEIGQNTGSRGSIGYSRPELPNRGWVTLIAAIIGFLALLPFLAAVTYVWSSIKDAFRRPQAST